MNLIIDIPDSEYNELKGLYQLGLTSPVYKTFIEKICVEAIQNGTPYEPKKNCFGCQGDKDFGCEDCLNKQPVDLDKEIGLYKSKVAFYESQNTRGEYAVTARELKFVVELLEKLRSECLQGESS